MNAPDFFRLAGVTVRVDWRDERLRAKLAAALAHRTTTDTAATLQIEARSGRREWPIVGDNGLLLRDDATGLDVVDSARRIALRVDAAGTRAVFECDDPDQLRVPDLGAPFHLLLQRALAPRGVHLLHAGALALPDRGAVLLAARGGGGKSNTVLASLGSELQLIGEDYVAVDERKPPQVWSLYSTAKLHGPDVGKFPALAHDVTAPAAAGEKALLSLGRRHAARFADGPPLRAILVLKITGQRDTRLVPAPASEALRELVANPLMIVPSARRGLFEFTTRLAARLPICRLELGTDLRQPPQLIRDFLERAPP